MAKDLFGTDGIRGVAGESPLDPATVFAFGLALGGDLRAHGDDPEVLLGRDTRESGPWIAETVAGGLARQGIRVRDAGIVTTPGVAYLTRTGPFAAGVMISASHNPYQDNGIKVFGHSGFKLPDDEEHGIEQEIFRLLDGGVEPQRRKLESDAGLDELYLQYLIGTVTTLLNGMRLVVDCGNGAAYQLAPDLFRRLGADVQRVSCTPDGRNINLNCGALHVGNLRRAVLEAKAAAGVAFDGDADRAILVSGSGNIVNGDAMLLLAARWLKGQDRLPGSTVVATVMSNLGLEKALEHEDIRLLRTPVGDKYVLEEMVRTGAMLGGEQSGHVIFREWATTGDGMLTALRVLEIAAKTGSTLDELSAGLVIYPQKLVNVRVRERRPLAEIPAVREAIERCQKDLDGRVLVRYSGTEPLVRIMVEAAGLEQVEACAAHIAEVIEREIGIKGA
ncbi:MAG: phosphoglucosamine mutase [Acidobacteria bacterium]|nr:phosphoglucosamine mutase [Acidobacteriota bacterium]